LTLLAGAARTRRTRTAQFRLIENDEICQLTSTGPMKGSAYGYACSREARAV